MGFAWAEGIAPGKAQDILRNIQQYYLIPCRLRQGIVSVLLPRWKRYDNCLKITWKLLDDCLISAVWFCKSRKTRWNKYSQARFLEKDKEIPESLMFFYEMAAADIPHRKMDGTSRATDACRPPLILAFKSSNQLQSRRYWAPFLPLVYDQTQNPSFGLGPIPKPKLANNFGPIP